MLTDAVIGLLVAWCALVCHCQPLAVQKKPCSAARLHVSAPNQVAGSWIMLLGQLQGRVHHDTAGSTGEVEQAGDWESALYNRDEGCTDNDVRMFEGTASGTTSEATRQIPADYVAVEGAGHYKFHPERANWTDAQSSCLSEGGHLAVANSKTEAAAFVGFIKFGADSGAKAFHVGVYWSPIHGDFYTVTDHPIGEAGYEIWGRGQPDEYNEEKTCVAMEITRELFDDPCSNILPFLCEIDA